MKLSGVLTIVAVLLASACSPEPPVDKLSRELGGLRGQLLVPAADGYVRNGVGSTIRLKDGRLMHLVTRHRARARVSPDHWPSDIAALYSSDEGATWTRPRTMFPGNGGGSTQPGLARMKSGELAVTYSRIFGPDKAHKVFRWSADEGQTWSAEIPMGPADGYWTAAHDRLVVLSSGRLVTPLHMKLSVTPEQVATRVAWSDDNGRSWTVSPQALTVEAMIPAYAARKTTQAKGSFWEASIVERKDGSLLMLGRTYAGSLYATTSTDGGASWTAPKPTSLYTGASPGRVERLPGPDGLLVVIWNRCCLDPGSALLGRRLTLSAAVSRDGGETWDGARDIEAIAPVGRVEYPSILVSDGKAFITYRAQGRSLPPQGSQEYLAVLPLSWFDVQGQWHRPETAVEPVLPSPASRP